MYKHILALYEFGHFYNLLTELHMEDPKGYTNFLMITLDLFKEMIETLTPYLLKQTTFMREPLEVGLKPATTSHFLANGNLHAHMQ